MKLKINRVIKNWKFAKNILIDENILFKDSGFGRQFKSQCYANHWKDAFNEFNLEALILEPLYQNFIGNHFKEGAVVQEHTDYAPPGFVHTRCNLMLKKPIRGGNPILDGEEIQVDENDLWLCLASLEKHSTTPTELGERLVFSFGSLIPFEQIKKIIA